MFRCLYVPDVNEWHAWNRLWSYERTIVSKQASSYTNTQFEPFKTRLIPTYSYFSLQFILLSFVYFWMLCKGTPPVCFFLWLTCLSAGRHMHADTWTHRTSIFPVGFHSVAGPELTLCCKSYSCFPWGDVMNNDPISILRRVFWHGFERVSAGKILWSRMAMWQITHMLKFTKKCQIIFQSDCTNFSFLAVNKNCICSTSSSVLGIGQLLKLCL